MMDKQDDNDNAQLRSEEPSLSRSDGKKALEEAPGGPCWTESSPAPLTSSLSSSHPLFPLSSEDPQLPKTPPPTPASRPLSPHVSIDCSNSSQESPRLPESYHHSEPNLRQSVAPNDTLNVGISKELTPLMFRPATVTPANLSPLPKCPPITDDDEILEDFSPRARRYDDFSPRSGGFGYDRDRLPVRRGIPIEPSTPSVSTVQPGIFETMRTYVIAVLAHCSCERKPVQLFPMQPLPWVHRPDCRIIENMAKVNAPYNKTYCDDPGMCSYAAFEMMLTWKSDDPMSARTCLRVELQPELPSTIDNSGMAHLFAKYPGFRGMCIGEKEDYIFVAYTTEEQARHASKAIEGFLVAQLSSIHLSTVDIAKAEKMVKGTGRLQAIEECITRFLCRFLCCKKL